MSRQAPERHAEPARRLATARSLLFNPRNPEPNNGGAAVTYQQMLLEQYRIYLDLTDRLASRRSSVNSFFIAVNTAVVTAAGFFWQDPPIVSTWWVVVPLLAVLVLCATWFLLIAHHRTISAAKWTVIAAFEERLPAQPFSRAEWQGLLSADKDRRWWRRLTRLEQSVPVIFAAIYVLGAVLLATGE